MLPTSQKFGLIAFALLCGGLATNLFILQPPVRTANLESRLQDLSGKTLRTATAPVAKTSAKKQPQPENVKDATPVNLEPRANPEITRAIQRELKVKGYEPGREDGELTLVTRGAILAYEADTSLPLTGAARPALLKHIILGSAAELTSVATNPSPPPTQTATKIIKAIEQALANNGYDPGSADGVLTSQSVRAIRKFERDKGLRETGRISGALILELQPDQKSAHTSRSAG